MTYTWRISLIHATAFAGWAFDNGITEAARARRAGWAFICHREAETLQNIQIISFMCSSLLLVWPEIASAVKVLPVR
jgi:hypothetical protein